jgi:hypothetical protein
MPRDATVDAAIDAAPDASTIDAMQFALFDRIGVIQVKHIKGAKPPALTKTKPAIDRKIASGQLARPPWLQDHIGRTPITVFEIDEDGRSLAIAGHLVALVDATHHVEHALDFEGVHSDRAGPDDAVVSGGDYVLLDAHRAGDIVVVLVQDPLGDTSPRRLLGIDATSGAVLWSGPEGIDATSFALLGGYAIVATDNGRRLFEADTGK